MTTVTFYYSPGCAGCNEIEPVVRKAAKKKGMKFKKVNVDECNTDACQKMGFVPTVYIGKKELSMGELEALVG